MGQIVSQVLKQTKRSSSKKAQCTTNEAIVGGWEIKAKQEIKIVVCGSGGVGKSAFSIQFVSNHFVEDYDPTIEDSYRKQVVVNDDTYMLEVLDTAGQEEFSAMRDQWFRSGDAFLIVYSITNRSSFDELKQFYDKILKAKDASSGPMVLVANKSDLEHDRQVTTQEGKDFANQIGVPFLECSAKKRTNVDESFLQLVTQVKKYSGASGGGGVK